MLDTLLANAMEGLTIIEDDTGILGKILANQMGAYAEAAGRRVAHFKMEMGEAGGLGDDSPMWRRPSDDSAPSDSVRSGRSQLGQILGAGQRYVVRDPTDYDLLIIEDLSVYLYDKTVREVVDVVRRLSSQTKLKKSFIITLEKTLLGERTSSYVKSQADSVIVVRTEISAERVLRSLYIQKMRDTYPSEKLIKFTLDENGIQVDTREFLG